MTFGKPGRPAFGALVRAAISVCLVLSWADARADELSPCDSADADSLKTVCGVPVPEDIVAIPGSDWIVASSMPRDGNAGGIYLIDRRNRISTRAQFEIAEEHGNCDPLDAARFIAHGLAIREGIDGEHDLLVVGHGGREAIEIFSLDARKNKPLLTWTGCVAMPEGLEANSVAPLPDGFAFTSLYDITDRDWTARIRKLSAGERAGGVYRWTDADGIVALEIPALSGPNGIAASNDGKTLYLAGWGDRRLLAIDLHGSQLGKAVTLGFLPDNLHWAPDGTLLAAGQDITVDALFACTMAQNAPNYCARSFSVVRIDPDNLETLTSWHRPVKSGFGDSTAAVLADGELWLGSINGNCVALLKVADS